MNDTTTAASKAPAMQFGIFTVSDITEDPTTGPHAQRGREDPQHDHDRQARRGGRTRRLRAGRAPQPAVLVVLAHHDARLHRRPDRAPRPLDRDDPHHHERPGEDRRGLRDAAARVGRSRRPHARPRQHRPGLPVVRPGHPPGTAARDRELHLLHRLWREDVVDWEGQFRTPLQGFTSTPRPLDDVRAVRLARLDPHPRDRRAGRVLRRRLLREQHLLAQGALPAPHHAVPPALRPLRPRHARAGDRRPRRPGVHARRTRRTPSASSARTSTTPRSTATARRSRTSAR